MTNKEFSLQFDILYNNIMSNQAPGLNSYEKSMFLTKAQIFILKSYLDGKTNPLGEGIDDSHKRQLDFSNLMDVWQAPISTSGTLISNHRNSLYVFLSKEAESGPKKILSFLNEQVILGPDFTYPRRQVTPISHKEFMRLMSKPYKEPLKNQVWRLINSKYDSEENNVIYETINLELIFNKADYNKAVDNDTQAKYILNYVRYPRPIILKETGESWSEWGVTIDGLDNTNESTCELDVNIHEDILYKAVEMAKSAWLTTQNAQPTQTSK